MPTGAGGLGYYVRDSLRGSVCGAEVAQTATDTRRKVAGIDVVLSSGLVF